jgi:hypothetical protein
MLRIPHCLDHRITDGGKVVIPTHQLPFTPHEHYYFSVSGTYFYYRLSEPQGLVWPERLDKLQKFASLGLEPTTFQLIA